MTTDNPFVSLAADGLLLDIVLSVAGMNRDEMMKDIKQESKALMNEKYWDFNTGKVALKGIDAFRPIVELASKDSQSEEEEEQLKKFFGEGRLETLALLLAVRTILHTTLETLLQDEIRERAIKVLEAREVSNKEKAQ